MSTKTAAKKSLPVPAKAKEAEKPKVPAKVAAVKVPAIPAGKPAATPRPPKPASTAKQDQRFKAVADEIDESLWTTILACRNIENNSRADEINARRSLGRLLADTYVKHEKNNRVTTLLTEALDTNPDYIRASIKLFRVFPDDTAFGALISKCQTLGRVPTWSVVRRLVALDRPQQWQAIMERAAQGLVTVDNVQAEVKKLQGLPEGADATQALANGTHRVLPAQVGKLSDAVREKASLFTSWFSVDGGLSGHARRLLAAKAQSEWDPGMLASLRSMREAVAATAETAQKQAAELAEIEAEVQARLEADHKLPSAGRPKLSEVVKPTPALEAPPAPPALARRQPSAPREGLKGLRK